MMTEEEVRRFVDEATTITGDQVSVVDRIVERWLRDREEAADEARDAIFEDERDSWNGGY